MVVVGGRCYNHEISLGVVLRKKNDHNSDFIFI
jgi:hypothetical protein